MEPGSCVWTIRESLSLFKYLVQAPQEEKQTFPPPVTSCWVV